MLCDDVAFPTVYHRIYRRKFLMLSNQTSRYNYICKCIRMSLEFENALGNPFLSIHIGCKVHYFQSKRTGYRHFLLYFLYIHTITLFTTTLNMCGEVCEVLICWPQLLYSVHCTSQNRVK